MTTKVYFILGFLIALISFLPTKIENLHTRGVKSGSGNLGFPQLLQQTPLLKVINTSCTFIDRRKLSLRKQKQCISRTLMIMCFTASPLS